MNKSFLANEFYGPAKAIAKAGLSLGTKDMAAFYELMTAPITKILGHWFESEPLTASLATDALIGTMVIKMLFINKIENTPFNGYVQFPFERYHQKHLALDMSYCIT